LYHLIALCFTSSTAEIVHVLHLLSVFNFCIEYLLRSWCLCRNRLRCWLVLPQPSLGRVSQTQPSTITPCYSLLYRRLAPSHLVLAGSYLKMCYDFCPICGVSSIDLYGEKGRYATDRTYAEYCKCDTKKYYRCIVCQGKGWEPKGSLDPIDVTDTKRLDKNNYINVKLHNSRTRQSLS